MDSLSTLSTERSTLQTIQDDEQSLEQWPLFFKDKLVIGCTTSQVGICTLWAPTTKILSGIDKDQYCVAGNLYSRDGINYVLRNVLANPGIRHILLCGPDRSGSGEALVKLAKDGIDENHRIKGDPATIEREIGKDAVDLFRDNVAIIDLRGVADSARIKEALRGLRKNLPSFASHPILFPRSDPSCETYPSEENGFVVRGSTVAEAWVRILASITKFGRREKTEYSFFQRELLNITSVVTDEDPNNIQFVDWFPFPRERLEGTRGSSLDLPTLMQMTLPGISATGSLGYYGQLLTKNPVKDFAYTYGQRLYAYGERLTGFRGVDQIQTMIEKLRSVKYTRRAVAVLWEPDYDTDSENPPCLDLIQTNVRGEKLGLTAYFRSQDMFRAWPENAFALRKLQRFIADAVGVKAIGDLVIVSHSAHIYEDSWDNAVSVVNKQGASYLKNLPLSRDPRGNFVIRLERKAIVVEFHSQDGNHIATFRGKTSKQLETDISPFISKISHALYVGRELMKAEFCFREGIAYVQDRDILK